MIMTSKNSQKSSVNIEDLKKLSVDSLKRIDDKAVINKTDEIRLFAISRNESLRLPYFFEYYQNLGVDSFFIIDNNSSDDSIEILKQQENTHLYSTADNYKNHWFWMEHLLETFGKNYWCIVVDIDELFSFPHSEHFDLKELVYYLEKVEKSTAINSFLLDVYSDKSLKSINYHQGSNPVDVLNYFDCEYNVIYSPFIDQKTNKLFYQKSFTGGMRVRVFGQTINVNTLSKVSLFKYNPETYLHVGMHALNGCVMSNLQGVVFHTKFLSDFIAEVEEESQRGEHYDNAYFYKHYEKRLKEDTNISFHDAFSIKYIDSKQLVDLGMMETTNDFEEFVDSKLLTKKHV
jgi:Glycosyl transferase family 2